MKFGFRNSLIFFGVLLILGSWYLGDWAIWLGGPFLFTGIILNLLDQG